MRTSSALALLASTAALASAYTTHDIAVGGLNADGTPHLAFTPPSISAAVGDMVRFTFNVKNHSVTQSSFPEPCEKLANSYGTPIGFDSGFHPVAAGTANADLPTFEFTVNDTAPIWGYCKQVAAVQPGPTHCQSGMVFAVNAPASGNTFDKFLAMAEASGNSTSSASGTTTVTSTEAQFTSTVVIFEEGETTTITSTEAQFTATTTVAAASGSWTDAPGTATVPATHTITVGGNPQTTGFRYTPPNITADVGDKVVFEFMVKNHTVTQASFDEPCEKLKGSNGNLIGFDSGFMPVSNTTTSGFPTFEITVNDTNPIWGYCRQQAANFSHCGVGMVFSVNANPFSNKSFEAFQLNAVRLNGTGIVDPFGNLTAAPYAGLYSGKSAVDLAAASAGSDSDSDSASLAKLLNTYAPATLGLLAAALVLLIAVLGVGVALLRRSPASSSSISSLVSRGTPRYAQVPLTVPELGEYTGSSKETYEEPRYSDRGEEYSDRV